MSIAEAGSQVRPAPVPLSHHAYCAFVTRVAIERREVVRPFVQVRRRGETLCGQVEQLGEFSERGDWFKVATQLGTIWAPAANVRLCSGDGRCVCEPA